MSYATRSMLAAVAVVAAGLLGSSAHAAATIYNLGTLGGPYSVGRAINASGQVAGNSYMAGNTVRHAFLYSGTPGVDGQMIDLDAWLKANNPTEGAKWTLTVAHGLTDSGLITGYGDYNDGPGGLSDGTRVFILDASALVPEPGALSLLTAGSLLLLPRQRPARR